MAIDSERSPDEHASTKPSAFVTSQTSLAELAALFARLGATAFGGPAAHIAMMHDEVVNRRKWLTEERFLDLLGATKAPGPLLASEEFAHTCPASAVCMLQRL